MSLPWVQQLMIENSKEMACWPLCANLSVRNLGLLLLDWAYAVSQISYQEHFDRFSTWDFCWILAANFAYSMKNFLSYLNITNLPIFSHLHLKFSKSAIMTQKFLFMKTSIWVLKKRRILCCCQISWCRFKQMPLYKKKQILNIFVFSHCFVVFCF